MPLQAQPPETDLIFPLPPEGETWDPCLIHTHYFGFSVPEAQIGGLTYIRYMPASRSAAPASSSTAASTT